MNKSTLHLTSTQFLLISAALGTLIVLVLVWARSNKTIVQPANQNPDVSQSEISWAECIATPKSVVTMSYPGTCQTPDGRRVVQPLNEEEQRRLDEETQQLQLQ